MLKEFKDFLMQGNIVTLAVAVVIGGAFGVVVASLVADLLTPLIGAIFGKADFSSIKIDIGDGALMVGNFMNALFAFVTVAAAIFFFVVKPMNALEAKAGKKKDPDAPSDEVVLLTEIRDALKAR